MNRLGRPPRPPEERFWKLVNVSEENDCWIWKGFHTPYGLLKVNGHVVPAHKFSWELHNKKKVPDGLFVLHECDNPPCVNPNHLFLGTPLDNMQDKIQKGRDRYAPAIGEQNGKHKLSDQDVKDIREKYANGISCIHLAQEYKIHRNHATRIISGKRRQYVK